MVTCTTPPFRAAVRLNSGVRAHMMNAAISGILLFLVMIPSAASEECEKNAANVHELSICVSAQGNVDRIASFQAALSVARARDRLEVRELVIAQNAWHRTVEKSCAYPDKTAMRACWKSLNEARIKALHRYRESLLPRDNASGL